MRRERRRRLLLWLGLFTLIFFGLGGLVLIVFVQQRDPLPVLFGAGDLWSQVIYGTILGIVIGGAAWYIIQQPFMRPVNEKYADMIGPLITRRWERIYISICAGAGEEIFFRGAIQHWLGIVLTAVLFVAIHGYLDPRDWRISLYGLFMTLAMMALGWMAAHHGLVAPIFAHAWIDMVLLEMLHRDWRSRRLPADQS